MRKGMFPEHLGDITMEELQELLRKKELQESLRKNLDNPTKTFPSLDALQQAFPVGFSVFAQIEVTAYDTPKERDEAIASFRVTPTMRPGEKVVGVMLIPRGLFPPKTSE